MDSIDDVRRRIPSTNAVLDDPRLRPQVERLGRPRVKAFVTATLHLARRGAVDPDGVIDAVEAGLARPVGTRVLNATGVLLHTNLGRAPLSTDAVEAVVRAAGCTDVEFDLASGARARRGRGALAALAERVPGAEAVHVVNNNAAALALVATVLAYDREIVVSRGEMVEIGDGFRIPDLLTSTGARLCEVGTTNRTTPQDYRAVVGPETGFVLKVHRSNFVVRGFTAEAGLGSLAGLDVPLVVDTGSGLLRPEPVLPEEPDAATALRDGADLVTASGDKLLGGPQCGLILGRADLVERVRRHPLARAMRVDKLTLAALEATLRGAPPPVVRALRTTAAALEERAATVAGRLRTCGVDASPTPTEASVGGGAAPEVVLPSAGVAVPASLAMPLRGGDPAVVGRLAEGRLILDLRSVDPASDEELVRLVASVSDPCT